MQITFAASVDSSSLFNNALQDVLAEWIQLVEGELNFLQRSPQWGSAWKGGDGKYLVSRSSLFWNCFAPGTLEQQIQILSPDLSSSQILQTKQMGGLKLSTSAALGMSTWNPTFSIHKCVFFWKRVALFEASTWQDSNDNDLSSVWPKTKSQKKTNDEDLFCFFNHTDKVSDKQSENGQLWGLNSVQRDVISTRHPDGLWCIQSPVKDLAHIWKHVPVCPRLEPSDVLPTNVLSASVTGLVVAGPEVSPDLMKFSEKQNTRNIAGNLSECECHHHRSSPLFAGSSFLCTSNQLSKIWDTGSCRPKRLCHLDDSRIMVLSENNPRFIPYADEALLWTYVGWCFSQRHSKESFYHKTSPVVQDNQAENMQNTTVFSCILFQMNSETQRSHSFVPRTAGHAWHETVNLDGMEQCMVPGDFLLQGMASEKQTWSSIIVLTARHSQLPDNQSHKQNCQMEQCVWHKLFWFREIANFFQSYKNKFVSETLSRDMHQKWDLRLEQGNTSLAKLYSWPNRILTLGIQANLHAHFVHGPAKRLGQRRHVLNAFLVRDGANRSEPLVAPHTRVLLSLLLHLCQEKHRNWEHEH